MVMDYSLESVELELGRNTAKWVIIHSVWQSTYCTTSAHRRDLLRISVFAAA